MKISAPFRRLTRRTLGMGRSPAITPEALQQLAAHEDVVVLGVGVLRPGSVDPRLPGQQRTASLLSLATAVADVPRERAIVLHCG